MATKRGKARRKGTKGTATARAGKSSRKRVIARRPGRAAAKKGRASSPSTRPPRSAAAAPQISARALASAQVSVTTRGKTVRDQVVDIFVAVTGHSDVEKRPLKDLTACCDEAFRATVAKKVTDTWSNLDHTYGASDIQCADTVDTLANRVSGDLV